jgi:hypothetical protein
MAIVRKKRNVLNNTSAAQFVIKLAWNPENVKDVIRCFVKYVFRDL